MTTTLNTETLTINRPDQAALTRSADSALAMVQSFDVCDAPTYELAAEELTAIKRKAATLEEQRKAITKPLDDAKKAVMDLFRGPLDLLGKAEAVLKGKMLTYQRAEEAKAAEARAAAERAAQAERSRLAAEAAELAAAGRAGEAMVKQQVAEMIVAAPPAVAEPPKVAGISTRKTIEFEVADMAALVQHIAAHPELIGMLEVNTTAVRGYVRGLGLACKLPGVRVFEQSSLSARR
jgi:hypothetical protein